MTTHPLAGHSHSAGHAPSCPILFSRLLAIRCVEKIQGTGHRTAQILDDMGVNHRGLNIRMPQIFLDLADVHAIEEKMSGERMAKGMDGSMFNNLGVSHRLFERGL